MTGRPEILVVAATQNELSSCVGSDKIAYLMTGVGPAATALSLSRAIIQYSPKLIIQIGIAGAISRDLEFLQAVYVADDRFGDMGAWRGGVFTSFDKTTYNSVYRPHLPFKTVTGVTVSTACSPFADRAGAQIETMEGAAFYQTAKAFNIPAIQLRTISNYIDTPRPNWRIEEAIANLSPALKVVTDMWLSEK